LASAVALAYAPLAFHSLKLLPVAAALATQALALWLVLRLRASVTLPRATAAGLAVGLACLARAEFLLFVPLALAVLWPPRGRLVPLLLLAGGVMVAIAPVSLHNARRGGFTLIATSGGENLFIGNQRGGDGGHRALDPKAGDLVSQRVLARKIAEEALGKPLSGSQVSAYWRERAWSEIATAPGEWLRLEGRKLARLVTPADPTDLFSLALERRAYLPSLYALALPTLGLWLLAILGGVSLRRRGFAAAWPLIGLLGVHLVALLTFFVNTRLRLPFLFWLCPLAGLGLAAALERWRAGRRGGILALAALLVIIALADLRLQQPKDREVLRLASVLSMQQRLDESLDALAPALGRADPGGLLLDQAGWVHSKKGEPDAALSYYRRALEAGLPLGREQQTRSRLAGVLEGMNRLQQAADEHRRSIALDPDEAGAWFERAKFRMRRGDRTGAIADLLEAKRLLPEWSAPREALQRLSAAPG
jgi:tetratricopeptide (TPR) repeat protein